MVKVREMTKEEGGWVKDNLRYDPDAGHLWWIKQNNNFGKGGPLRDLNRPAGHNTDGYLNVRINIIKPTKIGLHRVAWFLYHGVWPNDKIDHVNNVRNDNRIINLREATDVQNQGNRKIQVGGTSQYKGVSRFKQTCKWRADIKINHKQTYLGLYDNEEEAALAYNKAALEYFGEYAKINLIET